MKRCPDYDADCAHIVSHMHCYTAEACGPAGGYCPYLVPSPPEMVIVVQRAIHAASEDVDHEHG